MINLSIGGKKKPLHNSNAEQSVEQHHDMVVPIRHNGHRAMAYEDIFYDQAHPSLYLPTNLVQIPCNSVIKTEAAYYERDFHEPNEGIT